MILRRFRGTVLPWAAALALAACLKDHPLLLPENGYDPAMALRSDSLARFDSVEILLVDPEDSTRAIRIFKGPLVSAESLDAQVAGDGRTLVYLVRGWRADRGQCFAQRVTRDGQATVLMDTCAPAVKPPDKPAPDAVAKPAPLPPRFLADTLLVAETEAFRVIGLAGLAGTPPARLRVQWPEAPPVPDWLVPAPLRQDTADTQTVRIDVARQGLPQGSYEGMLLLANDTAVLDTLRIRMAVPRPPGAHVRGRIIARKDGAPEAGWVVRLEGESSAQVTGAEGAFDFGWRSPGTRRIDFAAAGRLGGTRLSTVVAGDTLAEADYAVPPAAGFLPVPLGWSRSLAGVAVAAGHAVIPSAEFETPGAVAIFPLDNGSASLQRFPDQGNGDGNRNVPEEYFEAGETAADSGAIYIAYPEANRLGRVGAWRSAPAAMNVAVGFQPAGLLAEAGTLLALGRLGGGTLALGEFDGATLAPLRLDTLAGHAWDGVLALQRGPRLKSHGDAWYAVDGNGPSVKGRLIKIDKATRRVAAWVELPEACASDLAIHRDRVFVTFADPSSRWLRSYHAADLRPADSVETGAPAYRIAFADTGRLAGYGFAATGDNAVTVLDYLSRRPVGRLLLPGSLKPRGLAVDAATGKVLISDDEKVFMAGF